ncbi:SDR family NAD(P)-dependent oxidoreductase [Anaerovibrio lipolyticus]|jgi:NAD(P)-dependent dehydrogenase (short-subunit alcohol dehydrogenase family)|uniref:SDR family NAD(P)-dependent oxidoreductase n=1 Tax=Anaerovibrio lipolyticus TaxID=82374 RepID=UPI0026F316DB|nr:SDR family oxidoreductase [Anaerovibrio lipolyticus]MBE6105118.1 SDR family oxidoreductase [Anaerovibrio lipolyticus]
MGKLDDKIAIVTGGTSGIGKSIVEHFLLEGAHVICVGRDKSKISDLLEMSEYSDRLDFFAADIGTAEGIESLKSGVEKKYAKLDILVNCAGIWHTHRLESITYNEFELMFKTNTASVIFMTQAFMPSLQKTNGNIINVSSIGGLEKHIAGRSQYLYAATKAAVIQFSQLCALNYADAVRVNCICPGPTDTPIYLNKDFSWVKEQIPMGRLGQSTDVAKVAVFLSSQDASYITGSIITVDGGASLK